MAITFPTVFQSSIATDPAATAAGYLTPTRYNQGCSVAGLGTNQLLYSTDATTLAQSSSMTYSETAGATPRFQVGAGDNVTTNGLIIGNLNQGNSGIWNTNISPSTSSGIVFNRLGGISLYAPTGIGLLLQANGGNQYCQIGLSNFALILNGGTVNVASGGSTTISTGIGSVKMSTANAATNAAWIPFAYAGTTYYVPAWTTNAP